MPYTISISIEKRFCFIIQSGHTGGLKCKICFLHSYLTISMIYLPFPHIQNVKFATLFFSDFSCFSYPKRDMRVSRLTMTKVPFLPIFAVTHGVQVTMGVTSLGTTMTINIATSVYSTQSFTSTKQTLIIAVVVPILFIIPLSKFDANIKGTANPGYLTTRLVNS